MLWLDSWTCREQTACICFIWSTTSSLFSMRGCLLLSLVYWKELLQQLLWLLLKMFIPKLELRDQDISRKLSLDPLVRALGSVSKTHFEIIQICRFNLLHVARSTCYTGLRDPPHPSVYLPIHTWWAPYPGACWGYSKFWAKKQRVNEQQENWVSKLIFCNSSRLVKIKLIQISNNNNSSQTAVNQKSHLYRTTAFLFCVNHFSETIGEGQAHFRSFFFTNISFPPKTLVTFSSYSDPTCMAICL